MIAYAETDVNSTLAYDAHRGTSFVPEKRAKQEAEGYVEHIKSVVDEFSGYATPENEAEIKAALEQYKAGYLKRLHANLSAKSRCLSVMIAGPSNFPVKRAEKANAAEHKRLEELIEFSEKAIERMHRQFDPRFISNAPISSDDPVAVAKLQEKIDAAVQAQENMKKANAILRRKGTKEQKMQWLQYELGYSLKLAAELLVPDYMGRTGFADYQLSNNNANIRRMKQRIDELKKAKSKPASADVRVEAHGATIVENKDENRLQIVFDGKPPVELRDRLKSRGFRWAPSQGAWQRQLTADARWAARWVLGIS